MMRILVTGGAGFIGSNLIRYLIKDKAYEVINVDKLTYAGNILSLESVESNDGYYFEKADICDRRKIEGILEEYRPDAVMHLAAESHVDRSIDGASAFIQTNIVGTYTLLECCSSYWAKLPSSKKDNFKFLHVSTDEVYGSLGATGAFTEKHRYQPNSPYSASKASSDHLVRSWYETYKFPAIITNCSNNFGPFQFPEKLIPVVILNALNQKPIPIYGEGKNFRDWLYVEDHVKALTLVLDKGLIGETYNIGGDSEISNIELAKMVCGMLDVLRPLKGTSYEELIMFTTDRPGHDFRYAIDFSKITNELGWKPTETFNSGIKKTIQWYIHSEAWIESCRKSHKETERIGVKTYTN